MWRNGRGQQQEGDQEVGGVLHGHVQDVPSMVAADIARVEYKSPKLEVEVDDNEISLALAILLSREEVEGLGLGEVVGKKKRKG